MLEIIQTSYPRFYQNTQSSDLVKAVDLWAEIFANDDVAVVATAIKSLIQHLEFPPTIADVRKEIEKITDTALGVPTAVDEWNAIRKAIGNSIYRAGEMFEGLPPVAKAYVGSPNQLRQWATAEDFNADVAKGQFLRQHDTLAQREKYKALLSENSVVARISDKLKVKYLEEKNG